jgi:SAM-dependent methyltransferase
MFKKVVSVKIDNQLKIAFQNLWENYFTSYDKLLLYGPYKKLILEEIPKAVGDIIDKNFSAENKLQILDLGTGTGNVIWGLNKKLTDKKIDFLGIDASDEILNIAKKKFENADNVKFRLGNIGLEKFGLNEEDYANLAQKKFPIIIMNNSFYCLNDKEKEIFLKNINDLISDNGVLIISDPKHAATMWAQFKLSLQHLKMNGLISGSKILIDNKKDFKNISNFNKRTIASKYKFLTIAEQKQLLEKWGWEVADKAINNTYCGHGYICFYKKVKA